MGTCTGKLWFVKIPASCKPVSVLTHLLQFIKDLNCQKCDTVKMPSSQFQVVMAFHIEVVDHCTKKFKEKNTKQNHSITNTKCQLTWHRYWPLPTNYWPGNISEVKSLCPLLERKKRWHSENSPELREQCPLHNGHASAQTHPWHRHRQSITYLSYVAPGFSSKTLAMLVAWVQWSTQAVGFTYSISSTIFKPSLSAQCLPRDFKCLCKIGFPAEYNYLN